MSEILPFIIFGSVFFLIGFCLFIREWKFFKKAIMLPAVVVDYRSKRESKGDTMYAPVVQFEFDGQIRRVEGSVYSSGKPKMGKQMKVGIDPNNINDVRLKQGSAYFLYWMFIIVGGALLTLGILSCFK